MDEIVVCPRCKGSLHPIRGLLSLSCSSCNLEYPVSDGIPRFIETDGYTSSFSDEWSKHSRTLLDSVSGLTSSEDIFFHRTGLRKSDLMGRLVLDAGCGAGRFLEVAHKYGARIVGLDMSFSVKQAAENIPGATIIQADLLKRLPLSPGAFDIVFSIGVLHHTPDAEYAFRNIATLVKEGGKLAVWLYAGDGAKQKLYNAVAATYRAVTTRMPPKMLYQICKMADPLYHLHRTPLGIVSRAVLPSSMEAIPEWRVLDTFDWYSPKYQSKHTYKQVRGWFEDCGFCDVTNLPFPTSMVGTKR